MPDSRGLRPRRGPMIRLLTGTMLSLLLTGCPPLTGAQVNWDAWKPDRSTEVTFPDLLVTPEDLPASSEGITFVDARSGDAYAAAHLPDARHLDIRGFLVDPPRLAGELARRGIGSADRLVCYADPEDPGAAGRLLWLLELAGHTGVRVLRGGLPAWREAGRPVDAGDPAPDPARFDLPLQRDRLITRSELAEVFGTPGHAVLDWRDPAEWVRGHVPHSLPFPLEELLNHGTLRDGPELRDLFAQWGPRPMEYVPADDAILILGDDPPGAVAVSPYLAARLAGRARVRVFPGGLREWRDAGLPLTRIIDAEETRDLLTANGTRPLADAPLPDVVLLDLRAAQDYVLKHIPGAVSLTTNRSPEDLEVVLARHWPGVDRGRVPLVAYCYGPTCTRSRNGTTLAARAGFHTVLWFHAGVQGWRALGEPMVSAPE